MKNHPSKERTLVIIKPDGVQRSLIGEIIKRYERVGLKLIALKMIIPSEEMAIKHYYEVGGDAWLEEVGKKARAAYEKKGMKSPYKTNMENGQAVMKSNAKYLSSGPVVAMIWQGNQAVGLVRKITGGTEPLTSDVGTIRGDFVSMAKSPRMSGLFEVILPSIPMQWLIWISGACGICFMPPVQLKKQKKKFQFGLKRMGC